MVMAKKSFWMAAVVLAWVGAGCSDLGPAADDLGSQIEAQRAIWDAWKPTAYVVDVERLCFCTEDARGPVRVRVRSGVPQSRVYVDGGGAVPDRFLDLFPGVEGLFDILADAVARDAHQVDVNWDPVSGAPLDFWIDYNPDIADEELGFRLVALPRADP